VPTESNLSAAAAGNTLVLTRTFDAPRERVFRAFAEAEALARWWGPKGFTIRVSTHEFRPGGIFHYKMEGPGGHEMWGRFVYREIVAPERIAWINAFSDPDGNLADDPWGMDIPREILNTVTLEERDGKTLLALHAAPLNATEAQQAVFDGMFDSMRQGYGGTWEKLDAFLAQTPAEGR